MSNSVTLRCAVYTRKSTEEGLDQEFNSLDAQREACEAFIASQASLGWKLVADRYDDGGISGGTMDRPALQQLLRDVSDGRVDVVIVYKIDRLTRSLADFARIVDVFDGKGVSFVSVTQQFNTTTSMGRLTLNVLLSFAQFEREITAERIRDKIAASKKKGMWMGGVVPLGYRLEERKLLIDEHEAGIVRYLFRRYLDLQSVRALSKEAIEQAFTVRPRRRSNMQGSQPQPFGRGNLYHLLSNPIYIGKIRHRGQLHDGEHQGIIDKKTFAAAQALLTEQAPKRASATNTGGLHLLTGLVHDEQGNLLRSVHATKKGVRYRYYVSKAKVEDTNTTGSGWRLPAKELDALVERHLNRILTDRRRLADWLDGWAQSDRIQDVIKRGERMWAEYESALPEARRDLLRLMFRRIDLQRGCVILELDSTWLCEVLVGDIINGAASPAREATRIECPIAFKRRGVETKIIIERDASAARKADPALVSLILRANRYLRQLTEQDGCKLADIARRNNTDLSEVSRLLPLAFLAPGAVDDILAGRQPVDLTAQRLSRFVDLPLSWSEQRTRLGA
jgi:DNA invertase Pin-like site-specific DNA recombinase